MTQLLAVSHTGLYSGAERVLERVLLAAAARGWQVTCCLPDGVFTERLAGTAVRTVAIPDLKLPAGPLPWAAARAAGRGAVTSRVLRREAAAADVVLANGLLALPAVRMARLNRPVLWHVHDIVTQPKWRALLRLVHGAVDVALPVSEATAEPLRRLGMRTRVVANGTPWPVEAAPDARGRTGRPVVGCAGLLTPWKGQDVLLEAVAQLPDVDVELAGGRFPKDAPYVERLQERAARPDLAGRVRLLGPVDDVAATMRRWWVFVSPSVEPDPGPLVVLEAMSVGIPVVATAHGGPLEFVGGGGLLVPPGDAGALADALRRLLDDGELRARLGACGRAQVEAGLQVGPRTEAVLDVLEQHARASS